MEHKPRPIGVVPAESAVIVAAKQASASREQLREWALVARAELQEAMNYWLDRPLASPHRKKCASVPRKAKVV